MARLGTRQSDTTLVRRAADGVSRSFRISFCVSSLSGTFYVLGFLSLRYLAIGWHRI